MIGRVLLALMLSAGIATAEERPVPASLPPAAEAGVWLDLDTGLARAKELGLPMFLWLAPCPSCGAKALADPDVASMLPDFVPVRGGIADARRLGLPEDRAHAVLLDASGLPIDEMIVSADASGALSTALIIDAMSSALDVLR